MKQPHKPQKPERKPHDSRFLSEGEKEVLFKRISENRNDRWVPIRGRSHRRTSAPKRDWSYLPENKTPQ